MMTAVFLIATAEAAPGRFELLVSALPHLLGMIVVLATLALLWGLCVLTSKVIRLLLPGQYAPEGKPAPIVASPAPAAAAPVSPEMVAALAAVAHERAGGVPPEIVAVIAGAVHMAVGKGSRVVAIRPGDGSWEKAGRHAVFGSRRLR